MNCGTVRRLPSSTSCRCTPCPLGSSGWRVIGCALLAGGNGRALREGLLSLNSSARCADVLCEDRIPSGRVEKRFGGGGGSFGPRVQNPPSPGACAVQYPLTPPPPPDDKVWATPEFLNVVYLTPHNSLHPPEPTGPRSNNPQGTAWPSGASAHKCSPTDDLRTRPHPIEVRPRKADRNGTWGVSHFECVHPKGSAMPGVASDS